MDEMELMAGLDAMASDPSLMEAAVGPPGAGGTVTCRVCSSQIDVASGEPVTPVTDQNVQAAMQYETMARQAQQGGAELPVGPGAMPGGF